MFGMETLDILIGLVTLYLAFGIAATACVEAIAALFRLRAKNLQTAIGELFSGNLAADTKVVDAIYASPLVETLSRGKRGLPSYLPRSLVAEVVTTAVVAGRAGEALADSIARLPDKTPDGEPNRFKLLLQHFADRAGGDLGRFQAGIEAHFDAVMERASGWYKRKAQAITLAVAAVLVIGANLDTVEIARTLATSPEVRESLLQVATRELAQERKNADTPIGTVADTNAALVRTQEAIALTGAASLGIGWQTHPVEPGGWITKAFGLLVSLLAVSLGAPFWFNVLRNLVNLRASGAVPRADITTGPAPVSAGPGPGSASPEPGGAGSASDAKGGK
ncbi:MAG: hypothetical protein ACPGU7_14145 [Gammaproteobacteria bacterium]